ncbi:MAG: segregation and condensation protein A [Chordicoccus sp.]
MALEVELGVFDGPLDLLLTLIEKNKINIFDIPIVEITDQYLAYVQKMKEEDLGLMSEFMVMASELIAIKCRMLLPKKEETEEEEEDPRDELVRRLLEYKTYKYMSYELKDRMDEAEEHVYKGETIPREVRKYRPDVDPEEVVGSLTLGKLHEVFDMVLKRQEDKVDPVRSRFGTIKREEVSLPEKLETVAGYAKEHARFSFCDLLEKQSSKMQVIVTFLAVLELMKYGVLRASQKDIEDDIDIEAVEGADTEKLRERYQEEADTDGERTEA